MTITLTREEAQQVLDALETITSRPEPMSYYCSFAVEIETLRARLSAPEPEKSLSQKLREAGYTKRDNSLECDECGKKFTRQMLPIHDCQPEPEPVAKMREMLEVQGRDGTWNYDPYFHGMYNGMEFMLALAEGRDPVFRKAPEKWLNAPPQRERVKFPTMLRKMWSGTEVQAWLDENANKEAE